MFSFVFEIKLIPDKLEIKQDVPGRRSLLWKIPFTNWKKKNHYNMVQIHLRGGIFIKECALMITFTSPFLLFCCFKITIGVEDWEQKPKIFVKEQRRVLYLYGQFNKPCLLLFFGFIGFFVCLFFKGMIINQSNILGTKSKQTKHVSCRVNTMLYAFGESA